MKKVLFIIIHLFCFSNLLFSNYQNSTNYGFEENKGQVLGEDAEKVKFFYSNNGITIFLMNNSIVYQFNNFSGENNNQTLETYRMDIELVNSNPSTKILKEGKSNDYVNYYNHNLTKVYHFEKITFQNVYSNIDWVIYIKNHQLKYDFVVKPGGNPNDIKLKTKWAEDVKILNNGNLELMNRMGKITENKPVSFQNNKSISTKFILNDEFISFQIDEYDINQTLIIDPELFWASYYGGTANDDITATCIDQDGNIYFSGKTYSTNQIANGGFQTIFTPSECEAYLVKFSPLGQRIWATYYGGNGYDQGNDCKVDSENNVYLVGSTFSTNNIAYLGYKNEHSNEGETIDNIYSEGFIVKFNPLGERIWGTYFGGEHSDHIASLSIDINDHVIVSGGTRSSAEIAHLGFMNTYSGGDDLFLAKFDKNCNLIWSTYYGDTEWETGSACASDSQGNIYLSGNTSSVNNISFNGHQDDFGGGFLNAFLVKFDADGDRIWGTYYAGDNGSTANSCSVDTDDNVYLSGSTRSLTGISFNGHQNTFGGGPDSDAYLVKFNPSGARMWGTYYGDYGSDIANKCVTDQLGNVYMVGVTSSVDNISFEGYQNSHGGGTYPDDGFLVKFDSLGVREWATYYGGQNSDKITDLVVSETGFLYLVGSTNSNTDISSNGFQNGLGGGYDGFIAKLVAHKDILSISSFQNQTELVVYPNPSNGEFKLELENDNEKEIKIIDIEGKLVYESKSTNTTEEFNLSFLSKGTYIILIVEGNTISTKQIVIE